MTENPRSQYRPTTVSAPGETLADLLEERGMTQAELATRMGRPPKTVNEIIKGKAAITPETALQLERVLGASAHFWLAREAGYREALARKADLARLKQDTGWLTELPTGEMRKLGWIDAAGSRAELVDLCLRFFGVADVEAWRARYVAPLASAAFRVSDKAEKRVGAVAAWLRQGEREAERIETRPYDRRAFLAALDEARALTLEPDAGQFFPRLQAICAAAGVAVVFVPAPKGCPASGATRWLSADKALIQLSFRYRTNDQVWFTFFHEAGHLVEHGKKMLFLELSNGMDRAEEQEADRFARDLLIPPHQAGRLSALPPSKKDIVAFAHEIGIAPGIVLGRMQREGRIPWDQLYDLKVRYSLSTGGEADV